MIDKCHIGDCREILPTLPKVQMCVTSPPYWGLRDYGTAQWESGDDGCDHMVDRFATAVSEKQASNTASGNKQARGVCPKCGAIRIDQQLGIEKTPEEYVANMVKIFRLVRDVLADDGTLWLNMGDSYTPVNRGENAKPRKEYPAGMQAAHMHADLPTKKSVIQATALSGLKTKDLVGIPWMVAFALRGDGWYLRSDIIWHKPNPMPESVTDRPTKAHEYLFLLSKQERYYYDAEAIKEPDNYTDHRRNRLCQPEPSGGLMSPHTGIRLENGRNGRGRNKRTVWTISTQPYADAHFATFPETLVEPCILAGSRISDIVLDPFFGSGTVGQVAERLGRRWIGIELNPEYAEMAKHRTSQIGLGL